VASSHSYIAVQAILKRSAERQLATSRSNTPPASSRSYSSGYRITLPEEIQPTEELVWWEIRMLR
jgi:hypothetical protein